MALVHCSSCNRTYDDESRWTICPHGPLWAGPDKYCAEHDLINCPHHGKEVRSIGDALCCGLISIEPAEAEMLLRDPAERYVEIREGTGERYLAIICNQDRGTVRLRIVQRVVASEGLLI